MFSNVKDTIHPARDFGNLIKEKIDNAIDVCAEHIRELMMSHYKSSVVFIACDMTTPSELSYNIALDRLKKKYKLHGDFITSLHDYVYGQVDDVQVRADTNYLLIGDSNLRNMRITHDTHIKVQVECYPGLQIHHLSTLLKGLSGKPNLKHIYMFVGINDADNDFTGTIKKRIDTLHNNIRENGYQCTFVNAPTTGANGSLSVKASNNIKSINDHAKKTFTGTMQLPLDEVGDDGIHLTLAASNRLAQRISNSISGIEKSSITGFMRQGHLN